MGDAHPEAEVLDVLDVGVMACRADGRVYYVNTAALRFFGVELADLAGKTSAEFGWDFVDPDGNRIPPAELATNCALRTEQAVRDRVVGVLRPGSDERLWLLVNAVPHFDEEGEMAGVVTSVSDISRRHAFEDLLRSANEALDRRVAERTAELEHRDAVHASVVRTMAEGVIVHDADGEIVEVNPAAEEILGATRREIFGKDPAPDGWLIIDRAQEPVPFEDLPSQYTLRTGEPVRDAELGVRRPDGALRWIRVNCEPRRGPHGLEGLVITLSDVTERRAAEDELEQSLTQLQALLTALPGVVIFTAEALFDRPPTITYLSAGAESLLGVPAEEAPAELERLVECVNPDDWSRVLELWQGPDRETEADQLHDFEAELRLRPTPRSPWRWANVRARPQVHHDRITWTGTVVDIDERKRLAEGLRRTQKMEAIGVLAAGVAHNFNNMLTAIIPNVEQASLLVDGEVRPYLTDASEAAHTAKELVRQLLVVARKEQSPEHVPVDLVPLLQGVVQLCRQSFGPRVDISLHASVEEAWVSGSPSHLNQVFINLCTNAHDASTEVARPQLDISLEGEDDTWIVRVDDNGVGMSGDSVQRLGEPFFTTKGPERGTGLGVATAFGIIHDHRAELGYDSVLGKGTTATVRLPVLSSGGDLASPPSPVEARASSLPAPTSRILVVDDEELVRRAVRRILVSAGHEVLEAADGDRALATVDRAGDAVDVVVLDVAMPGRPGLVVLEDLKRLQPDLPVILMTGLVSDDTDLSRAEGVLHKPVASAKLLSLIRELVDGRRARRDRYTSA